MEKKKVKPNLNNKLRRNVELDVIFTLASRLILSSILYCPLMMRDLMTASLGRFVPFRSFPSKGSLPDNNANKMIPRDQTSRGGPIG